MAFDAPIIHWPTIAAFAAYLQSVHRPVWCRGITNHNTYIPNATQWRGMTSMQSMIATYKAKGWSAGPHLYLAAQAPNPADTGIWQMTPLAHVGVHAGACNADHLGIESVGDFDAQPPTDAQYTLLLAVNRLFLQQWGLAASSVVVHNECMTGRTCPGRYLTGAQIRADLVAQPPPTPLPLPCRVHGLPVYQRSDRTGPLWGFLLPGEHVLVDDLHNGHLADGRGFVDLAGLERL